VRFQSARGLTTGPMWQPDCLLYEASSAADR